MRHRIATVLKRDLVLVSGSVCLELGGVAAPVRTQTPAQTDTHAGTVPAEARIVESNNEYAVIEITCSCGAKSHIQCNYAQLAGSETTPEQKPEPEQEQTQEQ